jgi:S-DNA-T family DNA segregation ATPase FtsK/SpoIIIE
MARTKGAGPASARSRVRRPARSRSRPAAARARRTRTPRTGSTPRTPLLSPDQRRELCGVGGIGAGVVLAAVLALPGGGSVAAPIHDGLFTWLGVGAWLLAAAPLVAGVRMIGAQNWSGGIQGAAGSLLTAVALLGFLGLVDPGTAGRVGQRLGPGLGNRLGGAAAGTAWLVVASLGLVLAVELRVGRVAAALRAWWAEARLADTEASVQAPAAPPPLALPAEAPAPGRRRRGAAVAETVPLPLFIPDGADTGTPPAEEPAPDEAPSPIIPFAREFEGLPVDPVPEPEPAVLGTVEVPLHAVELTTDEAEPERIWTVPSMELLDTVTGKRERLEAEIRTTRGTIESTLLAFGIDARVRGVNSGPTVTQYELQPAVGVPVRKIVSHQTDLSLALAAPIRIQAPIPGKAAIGIEVPNKAAQLVTLKDVVNSGAFGDVRSRLAVALGADVSGHPVVGDLARMPHLLIAGATGSGKSVCINAVLAGFLLQATPAQLKLILIDPKRVELSGFADIPHLLVPVVVEPDAAVASLRWAVREMEERYKLFASHGARNIAAFNERVPQLGLNPLPNIVVVIDELADLMMVAAGEIEDLICRIAQLARAVGIHLIVATQRPSADIITGLIKANIPSRIAFAVSSGVDSRVILDEMGAEKLLGRGDMLYLPIDQGKARRLQGAYVSDRELDRLIESWKAQGRPDYQEEIFQVEATVSWAKDATKRDPLFAKAAHTVAAEGRAAASLLQRKLNVGYTRAARLVDQLAEARVVGPYEGSKSREVLMDVIQVDEFLAEQGEE